jgi:hypothetical protein
MDAPVDLNAVKIWLEALAGPAGSAVVAFFLIRWLALTWWPQQQRAQTEREEHLREDHNNTISRLLSTHEANMTRLTNGLDRNTDIVQRMVETCLTRDRPTP